MSEEFPDVELENMYADAAAARKAFGSLRAPIEMVTAPHTPVPFTPSLEKLYIPSPEKIAEIREQIRAQLADERSIRQLLDDMRKQTYVSLRM